VTEPEQKTCPRCGARFTCCAPNACWCADFPPLAAVQAESDCLCPKCLQQATALERVLARREQNSPAIKCLPRAFTNKMKEKIVFCRSGGKDSALALRRLQTEGRYEVVSLLTACNEHLMLRRSKIVFMKTGMLEQAKKRELPVE
jgi:hypothetical protein